MRELKIIFCLIVVANALTDNCKIEWIETGHEVAESLYTLQLSVVNTDGDLRTYFPNTNYDIKIKSKASINQTFTHFYFKYWNQNETNSHGILSIRDEKLTMFHNGLYCKNRIIDSVSIAKHDVSIGWQSPPRGSGCIELKAFVKETDLRYHVTNLTVCQDPRVELDDPGEILRNCCACHDGKYELSFEGHWSRYTHPNNFPLREWLAVFPTVLGASHAPEMELWRPYALASKGMKNFAINGRTIDLELELKNKYQDISTLLKVRGSNFQNKTRKSYATLRVNKEKHVVSLVARIDPSPDWFVGVSKLELCRPDCTWIENKVFNLYAWDAGVRDGMLYEDLEEFTNPADPIQMLNMTWPPPRNGVWSPFYDQTNNTHDVRPLARIRFRLLHDNKMTCQVPIIAIPDEICVDEWGPWGRCSVECGTGVKKRTRVIKQDYDASTCNLTLEDTVTCQGTLSAECEKEVTEKDCVLSEWGEWTRCEKVCGQEKIQRSRNFRNNDEQCRKKFSSSPDYKMEEKMDCGNPPCPDDKFECPEEIYTSWTSWTPCSATVGEGKRHRYRTVKKGKISDRDSDVGYRACLGETETCVGTSYFDSVGLRNRGHLQDPDVTYNNKYGVPDYCFLPSDTGQCPDGRDDNSIKIYYDKDQGRCNTFTYSGCGGNMNRFNYDRDCFESCGRKVDCELSEWSEWTKCKKCDGYSTRSREPSRLPLNGGKECPKFNTIEHRPCRDVLKKCKNKKN